MITYVVLYVTVHLATYYLFVHVIGKPHHKNHKKIDLIGKMEPFNRIDVDKWNLIKLLPMVLTFWPRIIAGIINLSCYGIWVRICMIGVDINKPTIGPIRHMVIKRMGQLAFRL